MKAKFRDLITKKFEGASKVRMLTLVLALVYPWLVLAWSAQSGRMAYSLGYDDVSYAVDSSSRWNFFLNNSALDNLANFITNPPHSPLSTFFGMLGLPIFGISDFGFYFGNIILFYLLTILTYLIYFGLRFDYPDWITDATILVLMCSPIGFYLVHDSRPDMATGYLTVLAAFGVFGQRDNASRSYKNLVAVIFGLALISKPPFIPHTFLLVLVAFLSRWLIGNGRVGFLSAAKRFQDFVFRTIVFSAPLLVIEFKPTMDYVVENLFAKNKSVWTFPSSLSYTDIVFEYLHPWWMYMGGFITPLALVSAAVIAIVRRKMADPVCTLLAFLSATSLLFIAYLRYMNEYFFSSIHFAAVLMLPLIYRQIRITLKPRSIGILRMLAIAALFALMLSVTSFVHYPAYPETSSSERNDRLIAKFLQHENIESLYLTFSGPINQDNIGWESAKLGHSVQMSNGTFESSASAIEIQAEKYDSVLVPDLLTSTFNQDLPSGAIQGQVITNLLNAGYGYDLAFNKLGTRYHLLRKGGSVEGSIVVSVEGLSPVMFNRSNPAASDEYRSATGSGFNVCVFSQTVRKVHIRFVDSGKGPGFFVRLPRHAVMHSSPKGRENVFDASVTFGKGKSCMSAGAINSLNILSIQTSPGASKIF